MGTQNKYARMPLMPANVATRPEFARRWSPSGRKVEAKIRRDERNSLSAMSATQLVDYLDLTRAYPGQMYYSTLVGYRAALHEAVVIRHWTVEYSALDNSHHIY